MTGPLPGPGSEPAAVDLETQGQRRPLPQPEQRPYDPAPFRDKMRAWLAMLLLAILAATTLLPFGIIAWAPERAPAIHEHLSVIFTPLVALVASAVSFYFAARTSRDRYRCGSGISRLNSCTR